MCVYQAKKNLDGTLSLSSGQLQSLKNKNYTSNQIHFALLKLYERTNSIVPVQRSSTAADALSPCPDCGSSDFIPTGNCHACAVCGSSQGCS